MAIDYRRGTWSLEKEKEFHANLCDKIHKLFTNKRSDYGPTTQETWQRFGPTSMLTRIYDKLGRIQTLFENGTLGIEQKVMDESIIDSFMDCANYCLIAILEMTKFNQINEDLLKQSSIDEEIKPRLAYTGDELIDFYINSLNKKETVNDYKKFTDFCIKNTLIPLSKAAFLHQIALRGFSI